MSRPSSRFASERMQIAVRRKILTIDANHIQRGHIRARKPGTVPDLPLGWERRFAVVVADNAQRKTLRRLSRFFR